MADWRASDLLTEDEKLGIELADALSNTPANVSHDLRTRLQNRFSEKQLVELANEIAWENSRGRFNRAFGIEPDGYVDATAG